MKLNMVENCYLSQSIKFTGIELHSRVSSCLVIDLFDMNRTHILFQNNILITRVCRAHISKLSMPVRNEQKLFPTSLIFKFKNQIMCEV